MTPSPSPLASAPREQGPDPQAGTIPLPPSAQATTATAVGPRRGRRGSDRLPTFLVLVLAFLAASFYARNTDFWFYLATGRLLAQRQFTFGADPFAYTTQQVYWVCHAWLFDFVLYFLHGLVGGTGLVVVKALVVTALAGLLLSVRRPAGAAWLPAVSTAVAVLAMSPRLLLQPACVSYFFLGLTFWLLWQQQKAEGGRQRAEGSKASALRRFLPSGFCLLVFALWVNVDEWFFLGPLLTALFWLGERRQGQRTMPNWLVPAGLAVCLLNPFTYHVFTTLPAELSPVTWTSGLRQDVRYQAQFASPWQTEHWQAAVDLNAAALAYYALVLLGVASFLLHGTALRDWRLVVWLPFALLAAWQARTIPFFAIIAAPITALNWQDYLAGRLARATSATVRSARTGVLRGLSHSALTLGLLILIGLTWLGWLAGYDREERHVAWGVATEPALQEVTETLAQWRRQGLLSKDERVLAIAPEVAQYGAWFCPEEKQFFDHRYSLFSETARDYETVSRAILPELVPAPAHDSASGPSSRMSRPERVKDWWLVLRNNDVGIVVVYEREPQRLFALLHRLASGSKDWTLLHVTGQALILGCNEVRPPGGWDPLAFDADRLAFGSPEEQTAGGAPRAPEQGPEQLPPARGLWARLTRPAGQSSWESMASTVYLHYFNDSEATQRQQQIRTSLNRFAASLVGVPAQPAAVPQMTFQLVSSSSLLLGQDAAPHFVGREQLGPFFVHLVDRQPALPLLAVRAARRAVAINPEDATAWLRLGQAYLFLRNSTREHSSEGMLPPLNQLRHVQIVTALEQAVRLDPDLEAAHHELAFLYGERNYLDQSLEHRLEEARLSRRAGRRAGESAEELTNRLEFLDKDAAKLVELVQDRRKKLASASRALQGDRVAEANTALKLGLARHAANEILLQTNPDLLGPNGINLEMELLLSLGRVQEVREILSNKGVRASKHGLGHYDLAPPRGPDGGALYAIPYRWLSYEWLHVLEAAAAGDYAQAQGELRAIRAEVHANQDRLRQQQGVSEPRSLLLLLRLVAESPSFPSAFTAQALGQVFEERRALEAAEPALRAQQADLYVLEGLLALEQGDATAARSAFTAAQEMCAQPPNATVPFAGEPIAAGYLSKLGPSRQ
jgi:hypothetical protein